MAYLVVFNQNNINTIMQKNNNTHSLTSVTNVERESVRSDPKQYSLLKNKTPLLKMQMTRQVF